MSEVEITNKRLGAVRSGMTLHEALTAFRWYQPANKNRGEITKSSLVNWIEDGNRAYVKSQYGYTTYKVYCRVVNGKYFKYVRTYSDDTPTDNLINLPNF